MRFSLLILLLGFAAFAEPRLLEVPLAPQTTNYSCGAAAMQSVLGYLGYRYSENELIRLLKTNSTIGTDHLEIVKFAKSLGIDAEVKYNQTIADIKAEIDLLHPVIVEIQAWPDKPVPYLTTWDEGHDVVVIGIDTEKIYFADPVLFGARGYIRVVDFMERWHDLGAKNEKLYQTAIYFHATPQPPLPWQAIP